MENKTNKIVEVIKNKIGENIILEESKKKEKGKRFFTSDSHFNDKRLNLYSRDILFKDEKEVNEYIIERWNSVVGKNDLVYHLGDISMNSQGLELLNRLNGSKILIKGNYDISENDGGTAKYEINDKILSKYFDEIYDELEIEIGGETVYLNHFPTKCRQDVFNITAHVHNCWRFARNAINVGLDAWSYTPIDEDRVKFQMNGIRVHYDANVFAGELLANVLHRKGEVKILRAPEYDKVATFEECKDIFCFLAGPIQGTNSERMWQEEMIKKLQEELKNTKTNKNIVICSPRRQEKPDKDKFVYEEQVEWESFYLDKAAHHGIIVFWLAKEKEKIEGRSYAQTTRWEIAEWWAKSQEMNVNIVVGAEKGFEGTRYMEYKFNQTCPGFEMISNIDDMVFEIVKQIKKLI